MIKVDLTPLGKTINDKGEAEAYTCRAYDERQDGYIDSASVVTATFRASNAAQKSPLQQAINFRANAEKAVAAAIASATKSAKAEGGKE